MISELELTADDKAWMNKFHIAAENKIKREGLNFNFGINEIADEIILDVYSLHKESSLLYALWIELLSVIREYIKPSDFKYKTLDQFLAAYPGMYDNEPPIEKNRLWESANWMNILFRMMPARKNKGLVMIVIPKLVEGLDAKYVTGSGQTRLTANRVHLFETEGDTKANQRGKLKTASAKKKSIGQRSPTSSSSPTSLASSSAGAGKDASKKRKRSIDETNISRSQLMPPPSRRRAATEGKGLTGKAARLAASGATMPFIPQLSLPRSNSINSLATPSNYSGSGSRSRSSSSPLYPLYTSNHNAAAGGGGGTRRSPRNRKPSGLYSSEESPYVGYSVPMSQVPEEQATGIPVSLPPYRVGSNDELLVKTAYEEFRSNDTPRKPGEPFFPKTQLSSMQQLAEAAAATGTATGTGAATGVGSSIVQGSSSTAERGTVGNRPPTVSATYYPATAKHAGTGIGRGVGLLPRGSTTTTTTTAVGEGGGVGAKINRVPLGNTHPVATTAARADKRSSPLSLDTEAILRGDSTQSTGSSGGNVSFAIGTVFDTPRELAIANGQSPPDVHPPASSSYGVGREGEREATRRGGEGGISSLLSFAAHTDGDRGTTKSTYNIPATTSTITTVSTASATTTTTSTTAASSVIHCNNNGNGNGNTPGSLQRYQSEGLLGGDVLSFIQIAGPGELQRGYSWTEIPTGGNSNSNGQIDLSFNSMDDNGHEQDRAVEGVPLNGSAATDNTVATAGTIFRGKGAIFSSNEEKESVLLKSYSSDDIAYPCTQPTRNPAPVPPVAAAAAVPKSDVFSVNNGRIAARVPTKPTAAAAAAAAALAAISRPSNIVSRPSPAVPLNGASAQQAPSSSSSTTGTTTAVLPKQPTTLTKTTTTTTTQRNGGMKNQNQGVSTVSVSLSPSLHSTLATGGKAEGSHAMAVQNTDATGTAGKNLGLSAQNGRTLAEGKTLSSDNIKDMFNGYAY